MFTSCSCLRIDGCLSEIASGYGQCMPESKKFVQRISCSKGDRARDRSSFPSPRHYSSGRLLPGVKQMSDWCFFVFAIVFGCSWAMRQKLWAYWPRQPLGEEVGMHVWVNNACGFDIQGHCLLCVSYQLSILLFCNNYLYHSIILINWHCPWSGICC